MKLRLKNLGRASRIKIIKAGSLLAAVLFAINLLSAESESLVGGLEKESEKKSSVEYQVMGEASSMNKSSSEVWWLNSGGRVYFEDNRIWTIQGDLPEGDYWRERYFKSNPTETDDGAHPQNIFRLVTREQYKNPVQSIYFNINRYILSSDPHRSASNGVLFFHRYQNGDNLYYAGLRVDGHAVIKKKIKGVYYTMAYERIFEGEYHRDNNPNLLPLNKLMGIKTEVFDLENGHVEIRIYIDKDVNGEWELVAEAVDDGVSFGEGVFAEFGYAGIRSDFMDVEFEEYQIVE